ncbi:hypothetical protein KR059_001395, partial [Drosophila kikkawai]
MEAFLGIKGKDFVMLASATMNAHRGMLQQQCILHPLNKHSMLTVMGVADGNSLKFKKKILQHLEMFEIYNGHRLSLQAAVHFSSKNLLRFKRRQPNNQITILIGGFDPIRGPELHCIDYNGTVAAISYGVRGSHPEFCDVLLQDLYKPNLDQESAYNALRSCADKIKKKFVVNPFNFEVFVIKKEGTERVSE